MLISKISSAVFQHISVQSKYWIFSSPEARSVTLGKCQKAITAEALSRMPLESLQRFHTPRKVHALPSIPSAASRSQCLRRFDSMNPV